MPATRSPAAQDPFHNRRVELVDPEGDTFTLPAGAASRGTCLTYLRKGFAFAHAADREAFAGHFLAPIETADLRGKAKRAAKPKPKTSPKAP